MTFALLGNALLMLLSREYSSFSIDARNKHSPKKTALPNIGSAGIKGLCRYATSSLSSEMKVGWMGPSERDMVFAPYTDPTA
jgi:hypothetical protein